MVLDTERKLRKSWVVWEEDGKYPHVIVEILSESTANTDRELKKQLYQDTRTYALTGKLVCVFKQNK